MSRTAIMASPKTNRDNCLTVAQNIIIFMFSSKSSKEIEIVVAFQKGGRGARKIGRLLFNVSSFFLSQNKVILRFSLLIDIQKLYFHPKIIVISKKKILTINQVHYPYLCHKDKVQTGGTVIVLL